MYKLIGGAALILAVASGAYYKGKTDEERRQLLEIARLNDHIYKVEQERVKIESALYKLQEELDAEALDDPLADNPSLGVDSLRRLNRFD